MRAGAAVREDCPAALEIVAALAARLARQGGAMLIVDYGYDRPGVADTLQAVSRHAFADPWVAPGERRSHRPCRFRRAGGGARGPSGRAISGPVGQGDWLGAMGIGQRAAALTAAAPERADEIEAARDRLVAPDQMGRLFKVMAMTGPGLAASRRGFAA